MLCSIPNGSFCNADLLGNIRVSKDPINMVTNKGEGAMNLEGDSPGFGSVYHDPGGIANVVSLSHLAKQPGVRIVLDTDKKNSFQVFRNGKL